MDNTLMIAIVAAGGAVSGSAITCVVNYLSSKAMADREDKRRREELERKTAEERLNKLYTPLLKMMSPSPPYDEGIYFDRELGGRIIDFIEKNETLASPELMHKFYEFTDYYYDGQGEVRRDWDRELFDIVDVEYKELKNILGYGRILKQPSKIRNLFKRLFLPFKKLKTNIDDKLRMWRIKRRRKRIAAK